MKVLFSSPRRWVVPTAIALAFGAWSTTARATWTIDVLDATAAAGSTGNFFDVVLTNTGGDDASIAGFAFLVSADAGVTLTTADDQTASPYIFAGGSLFAPGIVVIGFPAPPLPGPSLLAQDISTLPAGALISAGGLVGLGRVYFDVAAGVSGSIAITLAGDPDTNLADENFEAIAGTSITFNGGTIRVSDGVIPEPSTLALAGVALLAAAFARRRSR